MINLAMKYQLQSDSMGRAVVSLRQQTSTVKSEIEREQLKKEIYYLEKKSIETQRKADEYYDKARAIEKTYSGNNQSRDSNVHSKDEKVRDSYNNKTAGPEKINVPVVENEQDRNNPGSKSKTNQVINEFKVMSQTPYETTAQIPIDQPMIEGLVYRIQLGVFSKSVNPGRFKGLLPLCGETFQNGTIKYYAGLFSRLTDAEKALNKVHELGMKDSYIVSFYNGKSIPSNRAKELEKDQP